MSKGDLVNQQPFPLQSDSIITLVDQMIERALQRRASDIHLESQFDGVRVRFRIDGVLYDQPSVLGERAQNVLARIKVLAHTNIAEKRLPQDGRFSFFSKQHQKPIDIRVSTFPTVHGEKLVLRILDRDHDSIELERLGFDVQTLAACKKLLNVSSGFFLVVGPTGSGKTSTLYGALRYLNTPEKHIITLEDPVEYRVSGITQGHIHPEAGFTFERGIRALLRQDPDIAMIGEIRDAQSAKIAIEAALTGHLVLSTLHTVDAPSALVRLVDMGIEPFLVNAAISGILAQRLARKNCRDCVKESELHDAEKELIAQYKLPINKNYVGTGCDACFGIGMRGRTGIFELLVPSSSLKSLLSKRAMLPEFSAQAVMDGMRTMACDGAQKVNDGVISCAELVRALF